MYKLVWDDSIVRKLRKLTKYDKNIGELIQSKIELLEIQPFHPMLKNSQTARKTQKVLFLFIGLFKQISF